MTLVIVPGSPTILSTVQTKGRMSPALENLQSKWTRLKKDKVGKRKHDKVTQGYTASGLTCDFQSSTLSTGSYDAMCSSNIE